MYVKQSRMIGCYIKKFIILYKCSSSFGFVVREMEWLFSTKDGREDLCHSAGFERLVVVTLHRGHCYGNLDDVKEELSGKVMELAPSGIGSKQVTLHKDLNTLVTGL